MNYKPAQLIFYGIIIILLYFVSLLGNQGSIFFNLLILSVVVIFPLLFNISLLAQFFLFVILATIAQIIYLNTAYAVGYAGIESAFHLIVGFVLFVVSTEPIGSLRKTEKDSNRRLIAVFIILGTVALAVCLFRAF
jgi:hypothetical protein